MTCQASRIFILQVKRLLFRSDQAIFSFVMLQWSNGNSGYVCLVFVGYDLISQFQIDKAASQGVIQRVVGSTALQVAYKFGSNVDFRIPTR